jgi:hypothetical protein
MPLLITPAAPFETTSALSVPAVYAIIEKVNYDTRKRLIDYVVGYYANEAAYLAIAAQVQCVQLTLSFVQPATADEANSVPIFTFLEQGLTAQLTALLGPDVTIENVA